MCLVAASCSDSSPTEPSQGATAPDSSSSTDATNAPTETGSNPVSDLDPDSDDPHCDSRSRCPRQLTPTSWTGYHGFVSFMASLGDGKVISNVGQDFQLWDTTDFEWGRHVEIDPADLQIDLNGVWHLEGTRFIGQQNADPSKPSLVIMDVALDDPGASMTFTGPVGERSGEPFLVGEDRILTRLAPGGNGNFAVFPIAGGDPLFELDLDAFTARDSLPRAAATSPTGDIYFVAESSNLYRWDPPASPQAVTGGFIGNASNLVVTRNGLVLASRLDDVSIWDPESGVVTELTGLPPGEDVVRMRVLASDELPDGRIAVAYSDGRVAFWDRAQPSNPTIMTYDDIRDLDAAIVMPDGQLLLFFTTPMSVTFDEEPLWSVFRLITPPPAS